MIKIKLQGHEIKMRRWFYAFSSDETSGISNFYMIVAFRGIVNKLFRNIRKNNYFAHDGQEKSEIRATKLVTIIHYP